MQTIDPEEDERLEVLGLAKDPVLRRSWLLYMAQKALPFDQAIEWARTAEQFITSSPTEAHLSESRAKRPAMLRYEGDVVAAIVLLEMRQMSAVCAAAGDHEPRVPRREKGGDSASRSARRDRPDTRSALQLSCVP